MSLKVLHQLQIDLMLLMGLGEDEGYSWCYRLEVRSQLPILELRKAGLVLATVELQRDQPPQVRRPAPIAMTFDGHQLCLYRTRPNLERLGSAKLMEAAPLLAKSGVAKTPDAQAA